MVAIVQGGRGVLVRAATCTDRVGFHATLARSPSFVGADPERGRRVVARSGWRGDGRRGPRRVVREGPRGGIAAVPRLVDSRNREGVGAVGKRSVGPESVHTPLGITAVELTARERVVRV